MHSPRVYAVFILRDFSRKFFLARKLQNMNVKVPSNATLWCLPHIHFFKDRGSPHAFSCKGQSQDISLQSYICVTGKQTEGDLTNKWDIPRLYYFQAEVLLILNQNNRLGFFMNMIELLVLSAFLIIRTQNTAVLSSQTEGSGRWWFPVSMWWQTQLIPKHF